jgi:hypothetical protein
VQLGGEDVADAVLGLAPDGVEKQPVKIDCQILLEYLTYIYNNPKRRATQNKDKNKWSHIIFFVAPAAHRILMRLQIWLRPYCQAS